MYLFRLVCGKLAAGRAQRYLRKVEGGRSFYSTSAEVFRGKAPLSIGSGLLI